MLLVNGVRELIDGLGERVPRLFRLTEISQGAGELQV